jgi:hypothetical protein
MSFTIEGRAKGLPDVLRTWLWELSIPNIGAIVPGTTSEGLTVRTRSAIIPGKSNEVIESFFMGTKQYFPGKSYPTGSFITSIEETDDQYVMKVIHEWSNKIFDWNPDAEFAGSSSFAKKRSGMVDDGYLKLYKYGRRELTDRIVRFHNMWPQAISDVTLDYTSNDAVRYDVTWQYDYFTLIKYKI